MHDPKIIRATFLISGVVGMLIGLFLLLAAGQALAGFDLGAPTLPALLFARSAGAAILSLSVVNFVVAFHPFSLTMRTLAVGNVLIHLLSIAVDFSERYPRNTGAWASVALHVVLIAAFAYCIIHWREMTAAPEAR